MRTGIHSIPKGFMAGIAIVALLTMSSNSFAKPFKYKGSGSLTFVSSAFSYDGASPAVVLTGSGKDNLGGTFTFQCVAETVPSQTSCTAPDGTAGTEFVNVRSDCAAIYKEGQTFTTAIGPVGSQCVSSTTPSVGGHETYTLTGGTEKFEGVSGGYTVMFTGQTLAAGGTPPGSNGVFGADQFTTAGSVSR